MNLRDKKSGLVVI